MATTYGKRRRCSALLNGPLSPERLWANTTLKRKPKASNSSMISMASWGLVR
jgi:hypothetical protein